MRDLKRRRRTQRVRWAMGLAIFLSINLVLRLLLTMVNEAEYTDGILQLIQFREFTGIYPPVYTAFTWPLAHLIGPLWSGRIISALFSAGAVVPIYLIALRSFGMRAAVFSALVYTVAPVSLRWAPRVMTDATFSFFFWFACERLVAAQGAQTQKKTDWALLGACIFGAAAALTRYQGLLLAIPPLIIAVYKYRSRGFVPWKGLIGLLLYGLAPAWSLYAGNIHGEQFLERTGGVGPWLTFLLTGEPFFWTIPYFLTYPVFILAAVGMFVGHARRRYRMTPITIYVFAVLLIAHSLFASFQERYFLPLYGLLYIWAGVGMAVVDDRCRRRRPWLRPYTPILMVIWSLMISTFVLLGSRGAFSDIRKASEFAAEVIDEQEGGVIYTNEIYRREGESRPRIAATKVSFFSGKPAQYLALEFLSGEETLAPGDVVVFSSWDAVSGASLAQLNRLYALERIGTFTTVVTPIFPDNMESQILRQTPLALLYRYVNQNFQTDVFRVKGTRASP